MKSFTFTFLCLLILFCILASVATEMPNKGVLAQQTKKQTPLFNAKIPLKVPTESTYYVASTYNVAITYGIVSTISKVLEILDLLAGGPSKICRNQKSFWIPSN